MPSAYQLDKKYVIEFKPKIEKERYPRSAMPKTARTRFLTSQLSSTMASAIHR